MLFGNYEAIYFAYFVLCFESLGTEYRASYMLTNWSTTDLYPLPDSFNVHPVSAIRT